jgi:diguanylate cyclase (GGDEF)-like protein
LALDAQTLATALALVSVALACLLVLTWIESRGTPVFGTWALSFVLCAAAAVLVVARGQALELPALDLANTLRLVAFGLAFVAARRFAGRDANWLLALAPAVLWVAASLFLFGEDFRPRILTGALLLAASSFAVAAALWGVPARASVARVAAAVLALHGGFALARFAAALLSPASAAEGGFAHPLYPMTLVETLIVAVVLAFLLISATRERVTALYREVAMLDPLTGVCNRRGFNEEVGRMLARACRDGTPTALLLLDIDHFKSVNDRWGHLAGDRALQAFTGTVTAELRAGDLIGRLGGEEFAVALAGCDAGQALRLAERIRQAVAAQPVAVRDGGAAIRLTVSVGVAVGRDAESPQALLAEADAALYRAKASGRDRVEPTSDLHALAGRLFGEQDRAQARVA